jgi:hypothetical protein
MIINPWTSACYFPDTKAMGDGGIFHIHISRVPLEGICRMGPRFQEETQNQSHMTKYICSKDNTAFEETVKSC